MHVYSLQDSQISIPFSDRIRKLYLELSSECNLDCPMCFRKHFTQAFGSMDDTLLGKVLTEIESLPNLQEIVLGGIGEPLMHHRFKAVVSRIKGAGVPLTVTTNGYLLESLGEFLVEKEVDKLVVSFETGTVGHPDEHQLLEKIQQLTKHKRIKQKSKPSIVLFMVMTQENILDLSSFFEKLKDLGVGEVFLSNLLPVDENQKQLVLYPNPEPSEVKSFKNELLLNVLMHKIRCKTADFEIRTERSCDFVEKDAAVVRWDGEVAPCYRFLHNSQEIVLDNQKQIEAHSFGNMRNQNLLDIWNDRDYAWFRFIVHHGMYPSCIDCTLREGCEFIESTQRDCWGIENSCADCLWSRAIIKCP